MTANSLHKLFALYSWCKTRDEVSGMHVSSRSTQVSAAAVVAEFLTVKTTAKAVTAGRFSQPWHARHVRGPQPLQGFSARGCG